MSDRYIYNYTIIIIMIMVWTYCIFVSDWSRGYVSYVVLAQHGACLSSNILTAEEDNTQSAVCRVWRVWSMEGTGRIWPVTALSPDRPAVLRTLWPTSPELFLWLAYSWSSLWTGGHGGHGGHIAPGLSQCSDFHLSCSGSFVQLSSETQVRMF